MSDSLFEVCECSYLVDSRAAMMRALKLEEHILFGGHGSWIGNSGGLLDGCDLRWIFSNLFQINHHRS